MARRSSSGSRPWQPPAAPASASSPAADYGDAGLVSAATMKLFGELKCAPGSNGNVNDAWKATVGYTPQQAQWDNSGSQVVSCDASGGKYVLDKAVFSGTNVTSANAGLLDSSQWVVNMTLDGAATNSFGALATHQYDNYFPNIKTNADDAVLDQTAMALDGDVVSAPQTADALTTGQVQVRGPSGAPFTQAQADQLASQLKYGALPLSFTPVSVNSTSAQLGHAALVGGVTAGAIGLTLLAGTRFYGGGHRWSGLDPQRLGSRAPWRSSAG
jgi:preprotein translocase subunit SecD